MLGSRSYQETRLRPDPGDNDQAEGDDRFFAHCLSLVRGRSSPSA
jgi:hypothetical protein